MPPRGPRSVLCVVVETTSATATGDGCAPPATRPPICALSAHRISPTSFALSPNRDLANRGDLERGRKGRAPPPPELRTFLARELATLVEIDAVGVAAHAV